MSSSEDDENYQQVPDLNKIPPPKPKTNQKPLPELPKTPFKILTTSLPHPLYICGTDGPIFLCCHGLGLSSLSFAPICQYTQSFCTLVTFDFPQHYNSNQKTELSLQNLTQTVVDIIDYLSEKFLQTIILVGHSMGGSVATHAAKQRNSVVLGLIVIDVVEGSALQALDFMEGMAKSRQKEFSSYHEAADWYLTSGGVRNRQSTLMCIQGQLLEENGKLKWIVDLLESQKYWRQWFEGLTGAFLSYHSPKLLLIAEKERMDKELTIAQMQGKFQLCNFIILAVLYNVGHFVQEDDPKNTAKQFYNFIKVFKIAQNKQELQRLKEVGVGKFKPDIKNFIE